MCRLGNSGQALTEWISSLALLGILAAGLFSLLLTQWYRVKCSYQSFAAGHAYLHGRSIFNGAQILDLENSKIQSIAHCRSIKETTVLFHLDKKCCAVSPQ